MQPKRTVYRMERRSAAYATVNGAVDEEHAQAILEAKAHTLDRLRSLTNLEIEAVSDDLEVDAVLHIYVTPREAEAERIRRLEAAGQQRLEGL